MKPKKVRAQMRRLKRNGAIYGRLECKKDKTRSLHHNKEVCEGGQNNTENISYLPDWLHKFYHKLKRDGECDKVMFEPRVPTYEETYEQIEKAVLSSYMENER